MYLANASSFWTSGMNTFGRIEKYMGICIFIGRYKPVIGCGWRWLFPFVPRLYWGNTKDNNEDFVHRRTQSLNNCKNGSSDHLGSTSVGGKNTVLIDQIHNWSYSISLPVNMSVRLRACLFMYLQLYACGCKCVLMPNFMFVCQSLCVFAPCLSLPLWSSACLRMFRDHHCLSIGCLALSTSLFPACRLPVRLSVRVAFVGNRTPFVRRDCHLQWEWFFGTQLFGCCNRGDECFAFEMRWGCSGGGCCTCKCRVWSICLSPSKMEYMSRVEHFWFESFLCTHSPCTRNCYRAICVLVENCA